jgi:hypothetical protein
LLIALLLLPVPAATAAPTRQVNPWDFLPVLRNRATMAFVLA